MEIKITTKQILKVLHIFSWIIFIGLCIKAGGILANAIYAMVFSPVFVHNFWDGLNLSSLYDFDKGYFLSLTTQMSIVAVLQVILFYLIVKILYDNKLDMTQPFNNAMKKLISNISYLSLGIGMFSYWGAKNTKLLVEKGVTLPDIQSLGLGGADVWIFMGIILFVIAQIFKRGIEIQAENDLTI